ncbi:MAG: hydroxymethylbilane synthase [Solirubrobacteraceae bacterium]
MTRIGTRGSPLALAQAAWVAQRLPGDTEIVRITTSGDRGSAAIADKARWVSELEQALLDDRIDLAVHSAKDVPAELADGLELVAIPERADPRDAICGAPSLAALPASARLGTSSLRRAAQVRAARADLEVVSLRGNVDTRLRRLADGEVDALVIAMAGLQRLGRGGEVGAALNPDVLVPAAGQGALALQARPEALDAAALAVLSDPDTTACVNAERELTRALGASCDTPVGAHALRLRDGRIQLTGWVGLPDGSAWLRDRVCARAAGLGLGVAERMLAAGAGELLREAGAWGSAPERGRAG